MRRLTDWWTFSDTDLGEDLRRFGISTPILAVATFICVAVFQNCDGHLAAISNQIVPAVPAINNGLLWGIYQVPSVGQQSYQDFEAMVGKRPTVVGTSAWWLDKYDWSGFTNLYATPNGSNNWANEVSGRGSLPLMLWQPYDPDGIDCHSGAPYFANLRKYSAREVASGAFDTYIRNWATEVAAFKKPILFRTMHELNAERKLTSQSPCDYATAWDASLTIDGVVVNTPADVIAAWRHIVTIFREQGATNAKWVWSVLSWESTNFGGNNSIALTDIYPGDDYVDWIGIECYIFSGDPWSACTDKAHGIYNEVTSLAPNKPLMIAEMGAYQSNTGLDKKPDWITESLDPARENSIFKKFPKVKAILYWHDNRSEYSDLSINSSVDSENSFKAAIRSSVYLSP